jgi:hypothetical protein
METDAGPPDIPDVPDIFSLFQASGDFPDGPLPHTVYQNIRLGIQEDGTPHRIGPIIVLGKTAETRLDPAYDEGYIFITPPDPFGIFEDRPIRPEARPAPRGIGVLGTGLFSGGIMGHHGIHVPRPNQKAQPGPAQNRIRAGIPPIRLGYNPHPKSRIFKHPGHYRQGKRRMIPIGIAGDKNKITNIPAPPFHVPTGYGEEVQGF